MEAELKISRCRWVCCPLLLSKLSIVTTPWRRPTVQHFLVSGFDDMGASESDEQTPPYLRHLEYHIAPPYTLSLRSWNQNRTSAINYKIHKWHFITGIITFVLNFTGFLYHHQWSHNLISNKLLANMCLCTVLCFNKNYISQNSDKI